MQLNTITSFFIIFSLNPLFIEDVLADRGWIDVHFHVVGDKGEASGFDDAAERVLDVMDESGMDRIIALSPPRPFQSYDIQELISLQKKYPDKISVFGGGGTLNPMIQHAGDSSSVSIETKNEFEKIANNIIDSGAKGFGEITAHHVSLNPNHGYESVPADHPLLLLLADIAAKHDVPIDLHFDPVPETVDTPSELDSPRNPSVLKENISGFENLLSHNRKTKIVWAHAGSDPVGFYTPDLVSKLLKKHPNLYCSIRTTFRRNNPMRHPMRGINDEWIAVLKEYPDRFVLGSDSFVLTSGYSGPNGPRVFEKRTWIQREGINEVLSELDGDLAGKIGRENAIRIYNLEK